MLDKFIPDMYYQSIYRVNYKKLKEKGITLVIFDLDNTIATIDSKVPEKDAINLIRKIKSLGIRPILMTNSNRERTIPFRDGLEIDSCASSMKPFSKYYKKILSLYHTEPSHVACIGDQLLTDILGANKMGMTSILVNPICKRDRRITYVNRFFEKILFKLMEKNELFKKGKYDD